MPLAQRASARDEALTPARAGGTIVFRNNADRGATVLMRVRSFAD